MRTSIQSTDTSKKRKSMVNLDYSICLSLTSAYCLSSWYTWWHLC